MLEIKNLRFSVPGENSPVEILKGIDLSVEQGKLVVITGPNGGGKSTLAKNIMGVNIPTGGQILFNGQDVTHLTITERARLGISYGFQQPPRFKGLTVHDLLAMAAGRNLTRNESCQYLTQVGLCAKDYVDREVNASLSGGEVKRIEIATVLARNCSLMIFDEPEAGIDLWSFSKLTETFRNIHETNSATILIISHQERIITMADEVVLVSEGQILRRGTPDEILPDILGTTQGICCVLAGN
ncbi:MAG: ATP-binding cassette domain-containing protein [Clostridia bacterium]|nr:ATP-binding cassette domain-containing protein [Clostridia bacterium]